MSLSAVAGILDQKGGLRVVVTERWRMHHHVQKGERLFIVPGYMVQEPVSVAEAQNQLIPRVREYVSSQLEPVNHCGTCTHCCRVLPIDAFGKRPNIVCHNCVVGKGCRVYAMAPIECRTFKCLWRRSQDTKKPMSQELRPDRCGVLLTHDTAGARNQTPDPDLIEVHPDLDNPQAVDGKAIQQFLTGKKTKLITFYYGR